MDHTSIFFALMGIGTAFLGLICLGVWRIAGNCSTNGERQSEEASVSVPAAAPAATIDGTISQELVAAISAAIAEELGTDISGIRIQSIKRV